MTERKKSHQEEYAEKIAKELIERLKLGTAPFQLPWQPDMGRDFPFNRTRDFIVLPPKERFFGQGEYYAVALHELGHWTGHADRLNRDMGGRFGDSSYAREELRAEISSMMMSRELGLPHNPDRHAGYVGDWVKVLTEEPMEILKASQDAAKIKEFIFSFEKQIEIDRERNQSIDQATNTIRPSENEKFVEPGNQTLEERVQAAKERYEDRFSEISANDQKKYRHLEEGMEKLIKGLPEHTQAQVRFHFYQSQYEHMSVKNELEQSPAQQEMFYGR